MLRRNFLNNKIKGFTLIELLVVISIISLLSTVVLASLNDARRKARNSQVLGEVRQWLNAFELYKADNNGNIPFQEINTGSYNSYHHACLGGSDSSCNSDQSNFNNKMDKYINVTKNINRNTIPKFFAKYDMSFDGDDGRDSENKHIEIIWYLEKTGQKCSFNAYSQNWLSDTTKCYLTLYYGPL